MVQSTLVDNTDLDSIVTRREALVFPVTFVSLSAVLVAAAIYIFFRYHLPADGWWALPGGICYVLFIPFLAAGGLAAAASKMLEQYHYVRGFYHCSRCGRPRTSSNVPCPCLRDDPALEFLFRKRPRRRFLYRYRKRLATVSLVWMALMVPAVCLALLFPHPLYSRGQSIMLLHILICAAVLPLGVALNEVLKMFDLARRFRLRSEAFLCVFSVLPIALMIFWGTWAL